MIKFAHFYVKLPIIRNCLFIRSVENFSKISGHQKINRHMEALRSDHLLLFIKNIVPSIS
jgi:phage terminase large subunit